jgi:hypothetical protein
MTALAAELTVPAPWRRISTGDTTISVAERAALGTSTGLRCGHRRTSVAHWLRWTTS